MMKLNLKKLAMSVAAFLVVLSVYADSDATEQNDSTPYGETVLTTDNKDPKKKRIPSRNVLELIYSDNMLSLTSNYYDGEFTIRFESNETGEIVTVPSIFVGDICIIDLDCGEYTVNAERSDGISFTGYLEISY